MTFEDAMIEVANATDADGKRVILYRGELTSEGLREATRIFAESILPKGTVFLSGPEMKVSAEAEASAWENLAKLANATAAAVREGK